MAITCDLIPFHAFVPAAFSLGVHALGSNTVKACLSTTVPIMQTDDTLSDLTQVASGNGYTTDGVTCTVDEPESWIGGIYRLVLSDIPGWTATGSGFTFKGVNFFNNTATNKNLIGSIFNSAVGQQTITNVSQSGTTATITKAEHGYSASDVVVITGLPFPRMNGTFTIGTVTTNTFTITVSASATIASQAATGKVIRPESVSLDAGGTYDVTSNPTTGIFTASMKGVTV